MAIPLLRSPPFPWLAPGVAAVSAPGRCEIADPDRVIAALRDARVGGDFWHAHADPWAQPAVRVDRTAPLDERAVIAWLAHGTVCDVAGAPIDPVALRGATIDLLGAARYRDPFSGQAIGPLDAIALLAGWRRVIHANRGIVAAAGMAAWKRDAIAQFLWDGARSPPFLMPDAALLRAPPGAAIAAWPSRVPGALIDQAAARGVATWFVEDGFLRSTGLGAECRPPMSIMVDRTGGVHFDASRTSEIETLLATADFPPLLLARAARLRARIVAGRLSKYGVDRGGEPPDLPAGRRRVLAIGQVADDLSVTHAGGGSAGMHGFLAAVRAREPDAFIIYRPHPDVVAGLRRGTSAGEDLVDLTLSDGSLLSLVERVDAVHVLSSLTGFEALLRGVPVTVHGLPFYAGWGLTDDLAAMPPRRARCLSIDELVAAALILAPRYRDPVTQLPCEVETLVDRMIVAPAPRHTLLTGFRRAMGVTRRTLGRMERGA